MNLEFRSGLAQQWAVITCILSGGFLCIALFLEHALGYNPCPLCMMQRVWVAIVGLIAYVSLLHNPRWGIYPLLAIIAAGVGSGFSIRQLWLQSLPADQVPACGPDLQYMLEAFPLSDILIAMTSGTGDCANEPPFLGFPIPGWMLIGFVMLIVASFIQLRQGNR